MKTVILLALFLTGCSTVEHWKTNEACSWDDRKILVTAEFVVADGSLLRVDRCVSRDDYYKFEGEQDYKRVCRLRGLTKDCYQ